MELSSCPESQETTSAGHASCDSEASGVDVKGYVVIYEHGETNWGAIVPDLPGCVSIGDTYQEVQVNVREAIQLYLDFLREKGKPAPQPTMRVGTVLIAS